MTPKQNDKVARYVFEQYLGKGGQASVSLVYDNIRCQRVALKRLVNVNPLNLMLLKKEFRVMKELIHPNLVRLYELGEDSQGIYFTMEYIDGIDLRAYCRPSQKGIRENEDSGLAKDNYLDTTTKTDVKLATSTAKSKPLKNIIAGTSWPLPAPALERMVHVLPQMLEALDFIHKSGIVHSDLKPENILVSEDGRLKLLDFGILREFGQSLSRTNRVDDRDSRIKGTPAYMSPEQIVGKPLTEASDIYNLGVIFHNLITGKTLFGESNDIMNCHLLVPPPKLSDLVDGIPTFLSDLCDALLSKDASRRPGIKELRDKLSLFLDMPEICTPYWEPMERFELLKRETEKTRIKQLISTVKKGRFGCLCLVGPTGSGKTALASWSKREARGDYLETFNGQGRLHERLAFNAIDAIIDELSYSIQKKMSASQIDELSTSFAIVCESFPILRLPFLHDTRFTKEQSAPQQVIFGALTRLIHAVGQVSKGLLIIVDDIQWADFDSVRFLDYIVRSKSDNVGLLLTIRNDVEENIALKWLEELPSEYMCPIPPLDDGAIRQIIEQQAEKQSLVPPSYDQMKKFVSSCAGSPFLAELVGYSLTPDPFETASKLDHSPIANVLHNIHPEERSLLAILIAVDTWYPIEQLAVLLRKTTGEVEDAVFNLSQKRIVRTSGYSRQFSKVDLYHDSIRDAVAKSLSENGLKTAHGLLAEFLYHDNSVPKEKLVRHLIACGRTRDAAKQAVLAAEIAESKNAHGLAAEMYGIAIKYSDDNIEQLLKLQSTAFAAGGLYAESAKAWNKLRIMQQKRNVSVRDTLICEAHALLASNQILEGKRVLEEFLRESGEQSLSGSKWTKFTSVLKFLLGPKKIKSGARLASFKKNQVKTLTKAGQQYMITSHLVTLFSPIQGMRFLQSAYRNFLQANNTELIAHCEYTFAYLSLFGNAKKGRVPLFRKYSESASSRIKGQEVSIVTRQFPNLLRSVEALREGDWAKAKQGIEKISEVFTDHGLEYTFEHMYIYYHQVISAQNSQDLDELDNCIQRVINWNRYVNDSATYFLMRLSEANLLFYRGKLQQSIDLLKSTQKMMPKNDLMFQTPFFQLNAILPEVYRSDCREGREAAFEVYLLVKKMGHLSSIFGGHIASKLALIEATALRSGDPNASYSFIKKMVRISKKAPPFYAGEASRAQAYAEDALGRTDKAVRLLEQAEIEATQYRLPINRAIAMYQLGLRTKGEKGCERMGNAIQIVEQVGSDKILLEEDFEYRSRKPN